jgi:hypothetical protein
MQSAGENGIRQPPQPVERGRVRAHGKERKDRDERPGHGGRAHPDPPLFELRDGANAGIAGPRTRVGFNGG